MKVDSDCKIITNFSVTGANVHDSKEIVGLVDENDEVAYADSAYVGEELQEPSRKRTRKLSSGFSEKGYKNKPLTDEQEENIREKSKVRVGLNMSMRREVCPNDTG